MRLALITSELPTPTRGGALMLHRLLQDPPPGSEVHVIHSGTDAPSTKDRHVVRPSAWFRRLRRTRFGPQLEHMDLLTGCSLPAGGLRQVLRQIAPDAILTVAYGSAWLAAARAADDLRLPLFSIFMDWWPDIARILHPAWRQPDSVNAKFVNLARDSRLVFGISPEILGELGPFSVSQRGIVLRPPSPRVPAARPFERHEPRRALYVGLSDSLYASPCTALVRSVAAFPGTRLQLITPALPAGLTSSLPANVARNGPVTDTELAEHCADADALVLVLPFTPELGRFVRTSFSSKYVDYLGRGRPIFIWGPDDAAVVRHARQTGAAHAVSDPDPAAFWREFESTLDDRARVAALIEAARSQGPEFEETHVRQTFWDAVLDPVTSHAV